MSKHPNTVLPNVLCSEEKLLPLTMGWQILLSECTADSLPPNVGEFSALEITSIKLARSDSADSHLSIVNAELLGAATPGFPEVPVTVL